MTANDLALAIWAEQIARGFGELGETANPEHIGNWIGNRTYPAETLQAAAQGDAGALAEVRREAGLPVLS